MKKLKRTKTLGKMEMHTVMNENVNPDHPDMTAVYSNSAKLPSPSSNEAVGSDKFIGLSDNLSFHGSDDDIVTPRMLTSGHNEIDRGDSMYPEDSHQGEGQEGVQQETGNETAGTSGAMTPFAE